MSIECIHYFVYVVCYLIIQQYYKATYIIMGCSIVVYRSPGGRWNFGVVHSETQSYNRDTKSSLYQNPLHFRAEIVKSSRDH